VAQGFARDIVSVMRLPLKMVVSPALENNILGISVKTKDHVQWMECGELGSLGGHAPEHVEEECALEEETAMHLHPKMVVGIAAAVESTLNTVTTIHAKLSTEIGGLGRSGSNAHKHVAWGGARDLAPAMRLPLKMVVSPAGEIISLGVTATKGHVQWMECGEIGSLGSHAPQHVAKERAGDFVTAMHLPHKMVDGNAAAMESKITTVKTTPAKPSYVLQQRH